MDEISAKRASGGFTVSKKKSSLLVRDTADSRDQSAQFCNRLGCSGRLKSTKGIHIGCPEKPKSLRPSFRSSSGKEIIGSSSKACSTVSNSRKSFLASQKNISSQMETDSSETSSVLDEPEALELITPPENILSGLLPELDEAECSDVTVMEAGNSSIASNTRFRKNIHQKSRLSNQETSMSSSVPVASKSTCQGVGASASRYNLRNLSCNSISDIVSPGCSSSELSFTRRKDMVKKRSPEGASSSSSKGKKMSGPLMGEKQNPISSHGISISDSRSRNWVPSRDNTLGSVRTRRSISDNGRARLSNQRNRNNLLPGDYPVVIPQRPHHEMAGNASSSLRQFSAEGTPGQPNSCSRPGSSSENLRRIMPVNPSNVGITRSLMNRDGMRYYNIDGIAEVLLALERIEQEEEEISYEQLLVLETNLFLNGLAFHDQHRDMRLDIDNMSYEELLDLEERMGTVSTALSEETLSNCLTSSTYHPAAPETRVTSSIGDHDDVKCSICQEEYSVGDEVGKLPCDHGYHVGCIQQWLRLKNWCPICKSPAVPSPSSSSSHSS